MFCGLAGVLVLHQGAGMERAWGGLKAQYREDVINGYILTCRRSSETVRVNKPGILSHEGVHGRRSEICMVLH